MLAQSDWARESSVEQTAPLISEHMGIPTSHLERVTSSHEPSLYDVARHVYSDEALFGAGLRQEWNRLTGTETAPEVFQSAYERYVSHPANLYVEAPQIYQFLKDHVFYSLEFRAMTPTEQVRQGVESLRPIEALRPEVWEGLTVQEREKTLQIVEYQLAEREGRPAAQVVVDVTKANQGGSYNLMTNMIHLNLDRVTDSYGVGKAIETIAHEGRHAYQYYCIEHPGVHPDTTQVGMWADNFRSGHYLTAELYGWFNYRNQPVEADAFAFGEAIRRGLYGGQ